MRGKRPLVSCFLTWVTASTTACLSEPVVDMTLRAPADAGQYDTSCITAVEIRAIGSQFAQDPADYTRACMELPRAASSYAELHDMVNGRFALDIPPSGLAGVTVRGWAGVTACERTDDSKSDYRSDFTSNLAFYAKTGYIGQDTLNLQAIPNLKCPTSRLSVRVVDMLALVASGSSTGCTTAMSYADHKGWSGVGTITPKLFGKGIEFFGNASWAEGTNNLVQLDAMVQLAQPGQTSCLALAGANEAGYNTACFVGGQSVCAAAGELETAAIRFDVWNQVDHTLQGRFPSIVWGSVWTNASPRTTIAGARVTIDPDHGKVVYVDPPDPAGIVKARTDQTATGPSGLFLVYSDAIVTAKIDAAGKSRTVQLGAPDYTMGGALIVMQ